MKDTKAAVVGKKSTKPILSPQTEERTMPLTEAIFEKPNEDTIRVLAYLKWEAAGCPECDGIAYWLESERELSAQTSTSIFTSYSRAQYS
ncbi:MAG: DUF2934 domain-containing protein [Pirellulaceae bacterium]|nr:DUF2934 domain-containing protein [Pirellulaceae bacterium]